MARFGGDIVVAIVLVGVMFLPVTITRGTAPHVTSSHLEVDPVAQRGVGEMMGASETEETVDVLDWTAYCAAHPDTDPTSFIAYARSQGRPVVLRNTPIVEEWAAFGKLSPRLLEEHGVVMPWAAHVHESQPARYFFEDRPMADMEEMQRSFDALFMREGAKTAAMSAKDFWGPPDDHFAYLSAKPGMMGGLDAGTLFSEVGVQWLRDGMPVAEGHAPGITLWMGTAGAHAHLHYDLSHNAFVHIYGRKRFTVLPPDAALTCYPKLHPGQRLAVASVDASTVAPAGRLVADLVPGDVMYLPPLYLHHASATTDSISANLWVLPPPVAFLRGLADRIQLPVDPRELSLFVDILVEAADLGMDSRQFVERYIVDARYKPALEEAGVSWATLVSQGVSVGPLGDTGDGVWAAEARRLRAAIQPAAQSMLRPRFLAVADPEVRKILLADFIEVAAHRVLQDMASVAYFLAHHTLQPS